MVEILPIKILTDEDNQIFGTLNVALGKLKRSGIAVANGIVVTPPDIVLKAILEHFDFGTKEVIEQSLTLVKKEVNSTAIPDVLGEDVRDVREFLLNRRVVKSKKHLWLALLSFWLDQIKQRLWKGGFSKGITEGLDPQVVIFIKKLEAFGSAYSRREELVHFDPLSDDTAISIGKGKLHPNDIKNLDEIVRTANKKLFIPHEYEWIVDGGVKLTKVLPYTPSPVIPFSTVIPAEAGIYKNNGSQIKSGMTKEGNDAKSAVKVFLDLSSGLVVEKDVDGIYIASEKIFDLNKPRDSFEDLVFRLVESATTFPNNPVLFKLADKSEGMGKVRGTLRLLHQNSLFDPMVDALDFARHKKGLTNIHIVVPFVRGVNEFLQIKRELAVKKLARKNSLQHWMEICVPENVVNLEDYLVAGLDGIVLNLDELIAHLNGFDATQQELVFYKNEVGGILKFLEDGLKLFHKSKTRFIACGSLVLYPQVLEFLVEKGVYGIVAEKYEAHFAKDLLHQTEKRIILRKAY